MIRLVRQRYGRKHVRLRFVVYGLERSGKDEAAWVELEDETDKLYLCLLWVDKQHRGKGHAHALLNCACALADAEDKIMDLVVSALDTRLGLDDDELIKLYRRYGFEDMGAAMMLRMPHTGLYNGYTSVIDKRSIT